MKTIYKSLLIETETDGLHRNVTVKKLNIHKNHTGYYFGVQQTTVLHQES